MNMLLLLRRGSLLPRLPSASSSVRGYSVATVDNPSNPVAQHADPDDALFEKVSREGITLPIIILCRGDTNRHHDDRTLDPEHFHLIEYIS